VREGVGELGDCLGTGAVTERDMRGARGIMVSSSSPGSMAESRPGHATSDTSVSVSVMMLWALATLATLADGRGNMGVDGGYRGVIGTLANNGSTKAFQGPRNGFPSTSRVSKDGKRHNQLGRELSLFRRILNE
jgi:hypothetical protein